MSMNSNTYFRQAIMKTDKHSNCQMFDVASTMNGLEGTFS